MTFSQTLDQHAAAGTLPPKYRIHLEEFYSSYLVSIGLTEPTPDVLNLFMRFLQFTEEQVANPHQFAPYHRGVREPVDYYQFGLDCIGGLLDKSKSTVTGLDNVQRMVDQITANENVVLLGNHQTEPDPQLIDLLLEATFPQIGSNLIFVAGERVLTDAMAIPFSLGRNLLCVFSRKYIERDTEKRAEKLAHNATTMRTMAKLFHEGGHAIYVAPSGGRDRPDDAGNILPSSFDSAAVEMFRLMANKSPRPCHFYPLALGSHHLMPPPAGLGTEVGEPRYTHGGGVHLAFGNEIDMDNFVGAEETNRKARRGHLAKHCWQLVSDLYKMFPKDAQRV